VHSNDVAAAGLPGLRRGTRVEYEIEAGPGGRPRAMRLRVVPRAASATAVG
jgi:cold shock CspA family protein